MLLQPVTPNVAMLPRLIPQLAQHLGTATDGDITLHASLSAEPSNVGARGVGGILPYLSVAAHTLTVGDASAPRQFPAGHAGVQPCTIAVHSASWPTTGTEPRPSAEAYAELLRRSLEALEGTHSLLMGEALPTHCATAVSADGASMLLRFEALVPTLSLQATPLYALSVLRSPLADSLRELSMRSQLRTGYLTMEQSRKLVVLSETDPKCFEVPLVGVWVSGVPSPSDPYVWAAAVRFARLQHGTAEVVTPPDSSGAFLLLAFEEWTDDDGGCPGGSSVSPQLYECRPQGSFSPYKIVGRGLQIALPVPTNASTPIKCDLFTTESHELSRLLRTLPPFPREGATSAVGPTPPASQQLRTRPAGEMMLPKKSLASALTSASGEESGGGALAGDGPANGAGAASGRAAGGDAAVSCHLSAPPSASDVAAAEAAAAKYARAAQAPPPLPAGTSGDEPAGPALSSGTEAALVAMVTQLQGQVQEMNERMEQQQSTIMRLTSELHRAALAGATAAAQPPPRHYSAPPVGEKHSPKKPSAEALHAAVLAATEEERATMKTYGRAAAAAEEEEEEEEARSDGEEDDDAPMLNVDPDAGVGLAGDDSGGGSGGSFGSGFGGGGFGGGGFGGGARSEVGVDPYDEVPRIVYEPDDDDDGLDLEDEGVGASEARELALSKDELSAAMEEEEDYAEGGAMLSLPD